MFTKTMAIFLTSLALLANLAIFKADNATISTEPLPPENSAEEPPPPPPGGERGGGFDPDSAGNGDY